MAERDEAFEDWDKRAYRAGSEDYRAHRSNAWHTCVEKVACALGLPVCNTVAEVKAAVEKRYGTKARP